MIFWRIYNSLNFLITLFAAEILVCSKLNRRKRWYLGLLALAVPITVSLLFTFLKMSFNPWFIASKYLIIFVLTIPVLLLMFEGNFQTYLFAGIMSYCAQHISYQIFGMIDRAGGDAIPNWADPLLLLPICAAVYCGLYYLFVRGLKRGESLAVNKTLQIVISGIILIITVYISFFGVINAVKSDTVFYIICIFSILSSALGILVETSLFTVKKGEIELAVIKHMLQSAQHQYDETKQSIDIINIKCHDLKHQIAALKGKVDKDELEKISEAVDIYDASFKTGNDALDVVLTEKGLICREKKIRLTCMLDGAALAAVKSSDIYSLFGNAIDNAIEAVEGLEDEKKIISISEMRREKLTCISIENFYSGDIQIRDSLPVTQKDTSYHGFGTKSIRMIAEQYGGEMRITVDGEIFALNIFLPLE